MTALSRPEDIKRGIEEQVGSVRRQKCGLLTVLSLTSQQVRYGLVAGQTSGKGNIDRRACVEIIMMRGDGQFRYGHSVSGLSV